MSDAVPPVGHDAPVASKDAPQSPNGVPDVQSGWLPPPEPLRSLWARGGNPLKPPDDLWWDEERKNVCREYLGTLMNWKEGCAKSTIPVGARDLPKPLHRDMLAVIRKCWPWTEYLDLQTRALALLTGEYGRGEVEVGEEWHDCLALGADYAKIDMVAEAVHDCRRRDERAKILKHMLSVAHSSEGIEDGIRRLQEVR